MHYVALQELNTTEIFLKMTFGSFVQKLNSFLNPF